MPTKLFWDKDIEAFKARLDSIIEVPNTDNLKTHFRQTILFKEERKLSGTITRDSFKILIHEQGRFGITGIFYPIIKGRLRPSNTGLQVELKSRMNIIGKTFFIVVGTICAYSILTGIVMQENNELRFVIPRLLVGTVLFAMMISVPSVIYFNTTRTVKKHLAKELGLKNAR